MQLCYLDIPNKVITLHQNCVHKEFIVLV